MKKLLSALLISACMATGFSAFADDSAATVKINVSGAGHDNRYFLCLEGVGCLSILGADKGKTFPVFHTIEMDNLYVADASRGLEVSPQGLPNSCNVSVGAKQTITITGTLAKAADGRVHIDGLRCNLS